MKTIKEFSAEVLSTKTGLLEQIDDCINILLSPIESHEERLRIKEKALKDDNFHLDDDNVHLLAEKGYELNGNRITLHYNETGSIGFLARDFGAIYNMVNSKFPNSAVLPQNKVRSYSAKGCKEYTAQELMSRRTTFEETQEAYDFAKHNYEEANISGNKKLIELFTNYAKVEIECMKIAKNTDYARIAKEKEYRASVCHNTWKYEFNQHSEMYYRLGFSPIGVDDYILLQEKDMLDVTYEEAAVIVKFFYSLKNGNCTGINDFIEKNTKNIINADMNLRTTYGRKDGNGFIQPKNNNDRHRFQSMQNDLDRYRFIKTTIDAIFAESEQKAAV